MNKQLQRAIAAFLVLLLPTISWGAETGAVVRSSTSVAVNGVPAISGLAIFDGDSVRSSKLAPATLSWHGNVVLLSADSAVQFSRQRLNVLGGTAAINTRQGIQSTIADISVRPTTSNARYEIRQQDGNVVIEAREGTVEIADASGSLLLKQGMAASIIPQAPVPASGSNSSSKSKPQQEADSKPENRGRRRGGPPLPASTTTAHAAGVSHAKLYAILGAIGGTAVAVGFFSMRGNSDSSPVCPNANSSTCN